MISPVEVKTVIRLRGIRKVYRNGPVAYEALRGIDLDVKRGEFVAVMGPSGSGKTTLLNIIGCLDMPTAGEYLLDSRPVSGMDIDELAEIRNRRIGFVFQAFHLLPYATAWENVELPLIIRGVSRRERKRRVGTILERMGLLAFAHHRPSELSGGQQQRVAIARALVTHPDILLADEPTGNLDSHTGQEIMQILTELWHEGMTLIVVTHDAEVATRAERVVHLRDGRIAMV